MLTTRKSEEKSTISLWNFKTSSKVSEFLDVASNGFLDISKDGKLAVDGHLRIFELATTKVNRKFATLTEHVCVKLTDDGLYMIWTDDISVKVGRVADGALIAHTSTHQSPTCLHLMDHGYLVLVGKKDGHLLAMKLSVQSEEGRVTYRHSKTFLIGANFLLDTSMHSEQCVSQMDPLYQYSARCILGRRYSNH